MNELKNQLNFSWHKIANRNGVTVEMRACPLVGNCEDKFASSQFRLQSLSEFVLRVTLSCLFPGESNRLKRNSLFSVSIPRNALVVEGAVSEILDASFEITGAGYCMGLNLYGSYPSGDQELCAYFQALKDFKSSGIFISVDSFGLLDPVPLELTGRLCSTLWLKKSNLDFLAFNAKKDPHDGWKELSEKISRIRVKYSVFIGVDDISSVDDLSLFSGEFFDLYKGPYIGDPIEDTVYSRLFGNI